MMSQEQNQRSRRPGLLAVAGIILLGAIAYANALNGEFVWDDQFLVVDNEILRDCSRLPKAFTEDIGAGAGKDFAFYRPLQTMSYMVDRALWKDNAKGYHATNVILHILAALSLYALIQAIFRDRLLSFLTAALFVVHPVHTEAVTYIAGRADPLALLFMLLAFTFYVRVPSAKGPWAFSAMTGCYALALLSKESSIILPVLVLLYTFCLGKSFEAKPFAALSGLALAAVLLRVTVLKATLPDLSGHPPLAQRLPGAFVALTSYIRLLLLPVNLHMEYGSPTFPWSDPRAVTGAVLLIAALTAIFLKGKKDPLVLFAGLWFLAGLLPVANIVPINAYMAEHWLYLPSIGFFLIAARILCVMNRSDLFKNLAVLITVVLLTFYSLSTLKQNTYWGRPVDLFRMILKYEPKSHKAHHNLGLAYDRMGRTQEALDSYRKAIALKPDPRAYNNLGNIYRKLKAHDEAIAALRRSIALDPGYAFAYNNLALAYNDLKRSDEALSAVRKALALRPEYTDAYHTLGTVYAAAGKNTEAIAAFKKAIERDPKHAKAYNNLGAVDMARGRYDDAAASFRKAVAIDPAFADAYINLGVVHKAMNRPDDSIAAYKKAIAVEHDNAEAYYNLGNIYAQQKRFDEAAAAYTKATAYRPDFAKAFLNLGNVYKADGNIGQAISSYKKALTIDPDYALAHNHLAVIYFQQGDPASALPHFDKAQALGFTNDLLKEALKPYRQP